MTYFYLLELRITGLYYRHTLISLELLYIRHRQIGSDSHWNPEKNAIPQFLLAPSEMAPPWFHEISFLFRC